MTPPRVYHGYMTCTVANDERLRAKYIALSPHLNERSRRIWAATEAMEYGTGGKARVYRVTGIDYKTIRRGCEELEEDDATRLDTGRIRRKGGGRKPQTVKDTTLKTAIETLVEDTTRGDPESPLKWTVKSTRMIAEALNTPVHRASHSLVARQLIDLDFSLQANRKTHEGGDHPDRDAQFQFINNKTKTFQASGNPVISVDTKKKENIGNFKNNGTTYRKKGNPEKVNVYDFIDKEKGKVSPYGVYDLAKDRGWVSVGISADTAQFAVNSIRSWWYSMGKQTYPDATELYINADGGGSNGYRVRLWKLELQTLATELNLTIHVSHFPPGTSKWNKIEHRLFSFISKNWQGRPLIDRATVVSLIGGTKTKTGLTVSVRLDEKEYERGIKVSDEALAAVHIERNDFHGEWNYTIHP